MRNLIVDYLKDRKRKRIKTKEIEEYLVKSLGMVQYRRRGGYLEFSQTMKELIREDIIRPIKAWKENGMSPALYNGHQLISSRQSLDSETKQKLLSYYHPLFDTTYYLNHPQEYKKDEEYLEMINKFLKDNRDLDRVTVNERSFQIFKDEKFILSNQGRELFNRLRLSLDNLNTYRTYEPFFYYQRQITDREINCLIVENKDTFFSLKILLQKGYWTWDDSDFSLLIYGEGRKIIKSFSYFYELENYKDKDVNFYYFGDLDLAGVTIWAELQRRYDSDIIPYYFFYSQLLIRYKEDAPKLKTEQYFDKEAIEQFLEYFSNSRGEEILKLFEEDRYLPQEGLNCALLKELADN